MSEFDHVVTGGKAMLTECDKWLETVSDEWLDNHSQTSLANEAWRKGASHAAQEILNHIDGIDTVHMAVAGLKEESTAIGEARISADRFI